MITRFYELKRSCRDYKILSENYLLVATCKNSSYSRKAKKLLLSIASKLILFLPTKPKKMTIDTRLKNQSNAMPIFLSFFKKIDPKLRTKTKFETLTFDLKFVYRTLKITRAI